MNNSVAEPLDFVRLRLRGAACEDNGSGSDLKSRKTHHIFLLSVFLTLEGFKS